MKQFKEIKIKKDDASLMLLVERMKELNDDYFSYDEEISDRVNKNCKNVCDGTYAVFRTNSESLFYAQVYIVKKNELRICNITSSDHRFSELGISRYNYVFDEFYHRIIEPCIDESFANCISITKEEYSIEEDLGSNVYNAFKTWENQCDKNAPITKPFDEKAWFKFVTELYKSNKPFDISNFGRWLAEECDWTCNDIIEEMKDNLEYSRSLLEYYDQNIN